MMSVFTTQPSGLGVQVAKDVSDLEHALGSALLSNEFMCKGQAESDPCFLKNESQSSEVEFCT